MIEHKISFVLANEKDKIFLLALRKASMNEHLKAAGIILNDQQHQQRIDEFFSDSYIILLNEKPIGLIKLAALIDRIHIRQFQLLPKYQGEGIGSLILNIVKRKARERQESITLNVLINNPAKLLYQRHDFIIIGVNQLEYNMRWTYSRK